MRLHGQRGVAIDHIFSVGVGSGTLIYGHRDGRCPYTRSGNRAGYRSARANGGVAGGRDGLSNFLEACRGRQQGAREEHQTGCIGISHIFEVDDDQASLDPEELLASVGIKRLPRPVLIHDSIALDGPPFPEMPFVGMQTECAERVNLIQSPTYILTLENFASFVRHVREVAPVDRGLVIYSGGFPSRPALGTIARLAAQADDGDMDAGGVCIFRHIERHLVLIGAGLRPHMMNADMLQRVGPHVTPRRRR